MRNAFADELTRLGDEDSRIVMLSGDIGNRLFDKFKARHPSRFFNCGVAEANMMGVAAGMGINGLRPVAYSIAPFVTTRCVTSTGQAPSALRANSSPPTVSPMSWVSRARRSTPSSAT